MIKNVVRTLICKNCKHVQEVKSATGVLQADNKVHYYFGSAYDFCDECDGPVKWNGKQRFVDEKDEK